MHIQHKELSEGKWFEMSFIEQLANIGSEINRIIKAKNDKIKSESAVLRSLELIDLTIQDKRWKNSLKEILRAREVLLDIIFGENQYSTTLEDLNKYFFYFALLHQLKK